MGNEITHIEKVEQDRASTAISRAHEVVLNTEEDMGWASDDLATLRKMRKEFEAKLKELCQPFKDGIEALKLYRREWDSDKKVFRDKPLHDWTSHAADAARYMAISWRELKPEEKKPAPKWAFQGVGDGITRTTTMNDLWAMTPKKNGRI